MSLLFGVANSSYTQSISKQLTTNWISIGAVAPELPNNLVGFVQSFEIKAHLAIRQTSRALDLIRRAWGWYLKNPYGTQSTCIEGYLADGSFGYRATDGYDDDYSYTSHAHGWGTGPTDALTSHVVGLTITQPGGSQWQFAPQFGDLTHAEGGFTTPMGKFTASWTLVEGGYTVVWNAPVGTVGVLVLPAASAGSRQPSVTLDGNLRAVQVGEYDLTMGLLTIKGSEGPHSAMVTL
jgi:Bacterial alpha-L-rhamnosidase C-terminal domain